jgi:hypothetical protein
MSVIMVKKLGAKQIIGDVKKAVKQFCANDGDKVTLYTIFGVANGIKTGTSNFGPWVSFQGTFEATNYVDGASYASNQAFITEPIQSMLMVALEDSDSVQFAITVDAKRRDDVAQGYEYITTPHLQTRENDPLAHLRAHVPQLAAPQAVAQLSAPEPEPTPEVVGSKSKSKSK